METQKLKPYHMENLYTILSKTPVPAAGEPTISMTALLELLKNADSEVKAQLRLALPT